MRLFVPLALAVLLPASSNFVMQEASGLERAVAAFNARAAVDSVGGEQAPLTVEAVVAAARWALLDPEERLLPASTVAGLEELAAEHTLPEDFELESLSSYAPDDRVVFEVWSVRLRVPGGTLRNGTTCVMIQERMIGSRLIGDEERAVIERWKGIWAAGVGSMLRAETMERYMRARAEAAKIDRQRDR